MSWITDDWRLKLLAVVLAVLMLGAVAFSQNPPTRGSLVVGLNYDTAAGISILNPPSRTTLIYTGLADAISQVSTANLTATVDASHAQPGTGVRLNVIAGTSVPGVNVQNPPPIVVNIDTRAIDNLQVEVKATPAQNFTLDGPPTATCGGVTPCVVQFDGPKSWEDAVGLKAVITYSAPVNITDIQQPSQPIVLYTNSGPFDINRVTQPSWSLTPSQADIHIKAKPGVTSNTVVLVDAPPSNGPPAGYRITNISISPATVVVSGEPSVLARNPRITLSAVDLSSATGTVTIQVTIPYPDGVTPVNGIQTAKITYTIQKNPSVSPSP